jgi:cytoskeletal protein RodZ
MAEHGHEHDDHGAAGAVDETPVSNSSIVGWGLLVMVVFFGTAAVATSLFHRITDQVEYEKVWSVRAPELNRLGEESQRLQTYGYSNADKTLAHIPIQEGMNQVIREAQQEAQAPAAPAAPTAPSPAAPAAPAAPSAAPAAGAAGGVTPAHPQAAGAVAR